MREFEKDYFAVRGRTPKSETTWETEYRAVFKRFEPGTKVNGEAILPIILETEPNTRARARVCNACNQIAKFVNIEFDANYYRGNYSSKQVQPRDIPSDETIAQRYESINNQPWQWVYGIMACYGLRNHEVFNIDPDYLQESPGILKILEGKTEERLVFPIYPEWWEKWKLWDVKFPNVTGKNNRALGSRVSQFFGRNELGQAYNLRHAWAIRSMLFGMDVSMAAAQMGHSVKVHSETYHQWITKDQQMRAFQILMERPDRPNAPEC